MDALKYTIPNEDFVLPREAGSGPKQNGGDAECCGHDGICNMGEVEVLSAHSGMAQRFHPYDSYQEGQIRRN